MGLDLIEASGSDVRLTFDTWHFWRSDPDHDLLATIPPGLIHEVQLADGGAQVVEDLQTDLLYHRKVPGSGAFDLAKTMAVLAGIGPIRPIGPETFSAEMNDLSAEASTRANADGLQQVLKPQDV